MQKNNPPISHEEAKRLENQLKTIRNLISRYYKFRKKKRDEIQPKQERLEQKIAALKNDPSSYSNVPFTSIQWSLKENVDEQIESLNARIGELWVGTLHHDYFTSTGQLEEFLRTSGIFGSTPFSVQLPRPRGTGETICLLDELNTQRRSLEYKLRPYRTFMGNIRRIQRTEKKKHDRAVAAARGGTTRNASESIRRKIRHDHPCPYCGRELSEEYHVDHIYPIKKGGLAHEKNMVSVCAVNAGVKIHQRPE